MLMPISNASPVVAVDQDDVPRGVSGDQDPGDMPQSGIARGRIHNDVYQLYSATVADYEVTFRLPNSLDLLKLTPEADVAINRRRLLELCLTSTRQHGQDVPAERLPDEVMSVVAEQMAQADPQADVQLALTCPECAHPWQAPLDIVSFLWSELHAWAGRLLQEVHELASAYGWSEAEVVGLSPARRRLYLELATA